MRALELASALGARLPAAVTAIGKVQLAFVSARDAEVRFDSSRFVEFARIRALGYALDEGATVPGVACVAAPVFSQNGCCGAIDVSALIHGGPTREAVIEAVIEAAARATVRLGGVQPQAFAMDQRRDLLSGNKAPQRPETSG